MIDFMRAIAGESDRFLAVIRMTDGHEAVPTCPDWTADDLLWHLTEVHAFWACILAEGALSDEDSRRVEANKPERPTGRAAMLEVFRAQTESLLAELGKRADSDPAWFWLKTARTVGSTRRMQAHEAVMHRVDAELTAGIESAAIDPGIAADGITHAVEVMWAWWGTLPGFRFKPVADAVELVASDVDRTWQLQPGRWVGVGQSGRIYDQPGVVLGAHAPTRSTVTGTVEELYRWLWGRGAEPALSGDRASLTALREAQSQGMQ